jgi:hypothetical protein
MGSVRSGLLPIVPDRFEPNEAIWFVKCTTSKGLLPEANLTR